MAEAQILAVVVLGAIWAVKIKRVARLIVAQGAVVAFERAPAPVALRVPGLDKA